MAPKAPRQKVLKNQSGGGFLAILNALAQMNGVSLAKNPSPLNQSKSGPVFGPANKEKTQDGKYLVGGQNVEKRFQQNIPNVTGMTMLNGTSSMVVEKTEALADVTTTGTAYAIKDQKFHVGSDGIPWLASISKSFVEYQILELEFTYVPTVPTTTAGSFMMAFTGDYQDTDPADQPEFLQSEQAVLSPVYSGTEGGRALQKFGFPMGDVVGFSVPKYTYCVGTSTTPQTYRIVNNATFTGFGNGDKNKYSPGKLIYATKGVEGGSTGTPKSVGQLFVRYRIRLLGSVKAGNNA